ncbi:MAG TPA: carbon-phosphorus lyase complex subunit PhnI, partial [Spirochaetia bacterium]|nr:carbon-phosphorus lyase complex subunit PhnI [Spirochaetia bacterium]
MGYVAVQGGTTAIESSRKLNRYLRLRGPSAPLTISQIMEQMGPLVDRVMGEGGLYSPFHAALAIKQASGDPIEAAFLLRAYRSTLRRLVDSVPVGTEEMRIERRISAAFKTIPGGQVLGSTSDYEQRILDFSLAEETVETQKEVVHDFEAGLCGEGSDRGEFRKVVEMLREQGLVPPVPERTAE